MNNNLPNIDYELLKKALNKKADLQEAKTPKVDDEIEEQKQKVSATPNDEESRMNTLKFLHLLEPDKLSLAKSRACQILKTQNPSEVLENHQTGHSA